MASYAAILAFLILCLLATSCLPGAEPTQPPLEKYHGAQEKNTDGPRSLNGQHNYLGPNGQYKYCFDPGCEEKMTVHPGAQEKYTDGEGSPNGEHKYEFGSGGQEKYTDGEGSPNGEHKYEFGSGGQEKYTDGEGSPNGEHKYEVDGVKKTKWAKALFFREKMLNEGVVMQMTDIRDKIHKRSFLSPTLIAKLPSLTTKNINLLKQFFRVSDNSASEKRMKETLGNCERAPARGEKIRCVRSMGEMEKFASSMLGPKVVLRKTLNVKGSGKNVMVGRVRRIHGGNVTESVTCHQEIFPVMLLYFCHYIPMVRVYEVEILNLQRININQAVAVCHLNTSLWSRNHPAFLELGSTPGEIEVCHWIFQNDMSWTADAN